MEEPTQPDPPTPAQVRERRATHTALIRFYQNTGALHWVVPMTAHGPSQRAFAVHEVVRCVVTQTPAAWEYLVTSSREGRIFPLALAEAFGTIDPDLTLALDVTPRNAMDAIAGTEGHILSVTVASNGVARHTWHLNAGHTQHIHPTTRVPTFSAIETAKELVRIYLSLYPQEQ